VVLFSQAAGWLRRNRVLLPGVTVLARQVAAARETSEARVYAALAAATRSVDPGLPERLANLLQVPDGSRVSVLERLRRSPRRSSGPEMVKALQRAEQLAVLGAGRVGVDGIPASRQQVLARTGLGSKASALARLGEPKRTATLVAVVRHLEAAAVDDTLDLLALLMATRLFSPARRASAGQRLAMLPRLEKASKTVARAGRVLLDQLAAAEDSGTRLDVAALWAAGGGPRGRAGWAQSHRPGAGAPGPSADHAGRGVEADRSPPRGSRRRPGSCPARMAAPGWSSATLTRSANPAAWSGCVRRRRR
jgi:hypothetical protein